MRISRVLLFALFYFVLLLPACGPATLSAIQTAIAQTATEGAARVAAEATLDAITTRFAATASEATAQQAAIQTVAIPLLQVEFANGCGDSVPPVGYELVIGDFVWLDTDRDSMQDAGESGFAGVRVELWDQFTQNLLGSTVTDATGHYYFCAKDTFDFRFCYETRLQFEPQPNYLWGERFNDDDEELDNDARQYLGSTRTICPVGIDLSLDASYRQITDEDMKTIEAATRVAGAIVTVSEDTNCRTGPGTDYPAVTVLEAGKSALVVEVFPGSEYVVVLIDETKCWLWLEYAEPNDFGNRGLPEATQPPTPTPGATQTPKPTKTPEPTLTPTPTPTPTPTQYIG